MLFVFLSTVSLVTPSSFTIRVPGPLLLSHRDPARPPFDPMNLHEPASPGTPRQVSLAAGFAATCACLQPEIALAKGGEYGVFEGRIVSLAHPAVMAIMYAASAWSAFTGWQWRRLRELGLKITVLKEDVKQPKAQIEAASSADMPPPTSAVQTVADLQSQIDELTAERKLLANGGFRDKHYQVGSLAPLVPPACDAPICRCCPDLSVVQRAGRHGYRVRTSRRDPAWCTLITGGFGRPRPWDFICYRGSGKHILTRTEVIPGASLVRRSRLFDPGCERGEVGIVDTGFGVKRVGDW